jgi:hypothetical protein
MSSVGRNFFEVCMMVFALCALEGRSQSIQRLIQLIAVEWVPPDVHLAPAKVYREFYKALFELYKTRSWPKDIGELGLLNSAV